MCGAGLFLMEMAKNGHFTGNLAVRIFLHLLCDTDTIKSISRRMETKTVIEGSERRRNERRMPLCHYPIVPGIVSSTQKNPDILCGAMWLWT